MKTVSNKLIGFPPIIGKSPRIIILGSMPGAESLRQRQYYGHPRNQFWKILQSVFKTERLDNYKEKKKMLVDHGVILWDVIRSCHRKGSLDSNLRNIQINQFKRLFDHHNTLKAVFCNGQTAFSLFNRYHVDHSLPVFVLPSTSPAYTLSFKEKLVQWRKILKFIQ